MICPDSPFMSLYHILGMVKENLVTKNVLIIHKEIPTSLRHFKRIRFLNKNPNEKKEKKKLHHVPTTK